MLCKTLLKINRQAPALVRTFVALRKPPTSANAATMMNDQQPLEEKATPGTTFKLTNDTLISKKMVQLLEADLDQGKSVKSLRAFNDTLSNLNESQFYEKMAPVFGELGHNLESFNPVFTACMLKVQMTLGFSDYKRRDESLQCLIQPLGGEYGLCAGYPLLKTHRALYSEWFQSVTGTAWEDFEAPEPEASKDLFSKMMGDISSGGGSKDAMEQASYALGYNLAVEYLAAYEKQWLLDSFRKLDESFLQAQGRKVEWEFLEIHAEGEPVHAELGHRAVTSLVPSNHQHIIAQAIRDHDNDFANFYNHLNKLLK